MATLLRALAQFLASDDTSIVDEVIEVVRQCDVRQLTPQLHHLAERTDTVGNHARHTLELMGDPHTT